MSDDPLSPSDRKHIGGAWSAGRPQIALPRNRSDDAPGSAGRDSHICAAPSGAVPTSEDRIEPSRARAVIRCLGHDHETDMVNLMLGLDQSSRCSRFGFPANNELLTEYCHHALATAAFIAGVYVDARLRGVSEVYDTRDAGIAEAAFLVDQAWRGQGLGMALLEAARQWAARSHRSALRMIISRDNWPMRKLADMAGARLDLVNDEIIADIAVCGKAPSSTLGSNGNSATGDL
jgi:GNAT superfamily N-acetyltransferase